LLFPLLLSRSIEKMESWVTEVVRRWEGERVGSSGKEEEET
jgi:hypothetical protein